MPIITIESNEVLRSAQRNRSALLCAIRRVAAANLHIPETAFTMHWKEHHGDGLVSLESDDRCTTVVDVRLVAGRSREVKHALMAAISDALAGAGIPPRQVTILLTELCPENWFDRGTPLA